MTNFETETVYIPSSDENRPAYSVTFFDDGSAICNCVSFKFRSSCRHLRAAAEQRGAEAALAPLRARIQSLAFKLLSTELTATDLETTRELWDSVDELELVLGRIRSRAK